MRSVCKKEVPVSLLKEIAATREFRVSDWAAVRDSIGPDENQAFDFYLAEVVNMIRDLKEPVAH